MFGKSKKGQAAMEYLMTYGWAILIIVIVLAILMYYFTSIKPPETCIFAQPGFRCDVKKPVIVSEDGTNDVYVIFRLDNQQGQSVIIKGYLCTTKSAGDVKKADFYTVSGIDPIPSGGSFEFSEENTDFGAKVYCVDDTGATVVMTPNSDFKGTLGILYNYHQEVSGAPERMATATLTGTVLAE